MNNIKILFLVFTWIVACTSSVRVLNRDSTLGFDLNKYKTFNFYEVTSHTDGSDTDFTSRVNNLKQGNQQELPQKGLNLSQKNPDLVVNVGIVTREKVQTRQSDFRSEAPRYIG